MRQPQMQCFLITLVQTCLVYLNSHVICFNMGGDKSCSGANAHIWTGIVFVLKVQYVKSRINFRLKHEKMSVITFDYFSKFLTRF